MFACRKVLGKIYVFSYPCKDSRNIFLKQINQELSRTLHSDVRKLCKGGKVFKKENPSLNISKQKAVLTTLKAPRSSKADSNSPEKTSVELSKTNDLKPPLNKNVQDSSQHPENKRDPESPDGGGSNPLMTNLKRALIVLGSLFAGYLVFDNFIDTENKDAKSDSKKKLGVKSLVSKDPPTSAEIPSEIGYLLIGGGTASFSAFRAIKSLDPKAKILVVSKEPFNPYMRPPLSKELYYHQDRQVALDLRFKQWNGVERSLYFEPEEFYAPVRELLESENGGVSIAKGWEVKELDATRKEVKLDDGKVIKYDKCLIASGGTPRNLPIFENAHEAIKKRVTLYRSIVDFREIEDVFNTAKPKTVAIIGGGFLGSELAVALAKRGDNKVEITQIMRGPGPLTKILPTYLSKSAAQRMLKEGISIKIDAEVKDVSLADNKLRITLTDGSVVSADHVIVALGIEPNTEFAEKSGLEVDEKNGGYLVNAQMLSCLDLYVAGDCASYYDRNLDKRRREEHHDNAVVTGRIAGENMAGKSSFYETQSMFWSEIGSALGFEAIGIVDSSLPTVAVFAKSDGDDNEPEKKESEYNKGVIFYLKNDLVVGVVLWNLYNKISIARQLLKEKKHYDDLNDVAKLFSIHGQDLEKELNVD